jgi:TrmH family RNA methyltransferase
MLPPSTADRSHAMRTITSRGNAIVRTFRDAADQPDATGTRLLLDGAHLVRDARAWGLRFEIVAVAASRLETATEEGEIARSLVREGFEVVSASDSVFAALSPVRHPTGIAAIATRPAAAVADLFAATEPFVLVAVDVQDPGNLGALLRAAEAGGVTGAFVCGQSANPFSWKALRGSMGSGIRLPIVSGMPLPGVLASMKQSGLATIAAVPRGGRDPDSVEWRGPVGVLLGGEGAGLAADVLASCDARVTIPMAVPVESLNVAVAGAVLVYAARRQRAGAATVPAATARA